MSLPPATQRAVEWMEAQLTELSSIRNATARDPSFKNWRQATLTVMQRIWPGDQDRSERFRRIPFSPADPRSDARAMREWYSRGCQEAARVINGFITDIRENGVPDAPGEELPQSQASEFEDGFPTVDLPSGDLGASSTPADIADNLLAAMADAPPQGSDPLSPVPARLHVDSPAAPAPAPPLAAAQASAPPTPPTFVEPEAPAPEPNAHPVSAVEIRPAPKKGIGMKARLRDLLGFAHLSAKALAGFPREAEPGSEPAAAEHEPVLGMQPLGDDVMPAPLPPPPVLAKPTAAGAALMPEWPMMPMQAGIAPATAPEPAEAIAPPAQVNPALPTLPTAAIEAIDTGLPIPEMRTEPGASVIMSTPTTLRGKVEKVSIESLISPEFRDPGGDNVTEDVAAAPEPAPTTEAAEPAAPPALATPPEPATPPVSSAPSVTPVFAELLPSVPPAPDEPTAEVEDAHEQSPVSGEFETLPTGRPTLKLVRPFVDDPEFNVEPAPKREPTDDAPPAPLTPPAPARAEKPSRVTPLPSRGAFPPPHEPEAEYPPDLVHDDDAPRGTREIEASTQATDDFMRSSPVLGASSRRGKRGFDETSFGDPDAIAVASMVPDLVRLGVPGERLPEVRARLLDLARRLERGELEWGGLRKAVWFAMEYPEVARRLMPVLLPWIDRAS